jgi:DNA mismatch repair protein MutS2
MVDDALDHLTSRLDEALLAGVMSVHIIHGHGTGKLKMAIRRYLSNSPYSKSFRQGSDGEGGEGVTVVEVK